MTIELDTSEADRKLARQAKILDDKAIQRAESRALNRAVRGARTEMSRQIRESVAMKARDIKDAIRLEKASASQSKPVATMVVSQQLVPLVKFSRPRQVRKGVSVTVIKGHRMTIEGAFVVDKLSGNVFRRTSSSRLPIKKMFGPSVRQLAPEALKKAGGRIEERLRKRLRHEIGRAVEKAFKKM